MPVIATMRKQRRRRSHPVWSISADLLMFSKWLSGGLDDELSCAGIEDNSKASAQKALE